MSMNSKSEHYWYGNFARFLLTTGGLAVFGKSESALLAATTAGVVGGNLFDAPNLLLYVG